MDSVPYKVVEYNQKSMGRGGSIVNTKIKNLLDGSVKTVTFKGQDKVESADIERKKLQYLYSDTNSGHFMDESTYEQFEISLDTIGDGMKYLVEGATAQAQLFEGRVINVELPVKVPLKIVEAPDVVKGDTQSTVLKTVTLENGTEIQTPIFIKAGDTIIVDTRDGSYVERKKD